MESPRTTDGTPPAIASVLSAGAMIDRRYRLEQNLGGGGGGTVWRCHDTKLDMTVALKIISSEGDLERWRREVAMARRIANRNVCRVHDLGEADGLRFVTMELVEGESLRARIGSAEHAASRRDVFTQVVSGVAAIHAAGVVHRDLKPDNIVVDREGRAVIVDFGLAREPKAPSGDRTLDDQVRHEAVTVQLRPGAERTPEPSLAAGPRTVTQAGVVVGTPRYMAPEQAAGETVDARADVWALGLIGHELLAGKLPAIGERGRIVDPAVEAAWPGIAPILERCLAMFPEERFADARELARALVPARRSRALRVALVAVPLCAVAAVIGVRAWPHHDESSRSSPAVQSNRLTTEQHPTSIAMAPDGKQYAYTIGTEVWVGRLAPASEPTRWATPTIESSSGTLSKLRAAYVAGWFSDGSLAVTGGGYGGTWYVFRLWPDGRHERLLDLAERPIIATTTQGDRIAVASRASIAIGAAVPQAARTTVLALPSGDVVTGLAWSPDASEVALIRAPGDWSPERIEVVPATGGTPRIAWTGELGSPLLAWLDATHMFVAQQDESGAQLLQIDPVRGGTLTRASWEHEYVGGGSAANGTLVLLRGTVRPSVMIYDLGWKPLHEAGIAGSDVAGWTSDGYVVYAEGAAGKHRIVRAKPDGPHAPWPGTTETDVPDTLAGDALIVHHADDHDTVVDRIAADGTRKPLTRLASHPGTVNPVRCAGDHAPPCILEEVTGTTVRWVELDPETGARGAVVHERALNGRHLRSAALSLDGARFAVVDGGTQVTVIERATGTTTTSYPMPDAELQSIAFAPAYLYATSVGFDGRPFGMIELRNRSMLLSDHRVSTRWYFRPTQGPGHAVAVAVRDYDVDLWRLDSIDR